MGVLAVLTVGTQEVQSDYLSEFVQGQLGATAKVEGRAIGNHLAELGDEELSTIITDETVRNGPCFRRLDREHPDGWMLGMVATDQPEDVSFRRSDTIGIARALQRWISLSRPHVTVLDPFPLAVAVGSGLEAEMHEGMAELLRHAGPVHHVVTLAIGGTPEMRLLAERELGLAVRPPAKLERWQPTPGGEVRTGSLVSLLDADRVRHGLLEQFLQAVQGGRFDAAGEVASALIKQGFAVGRTAADIVSEARNRLDDKGDLAKRFANQRSLALRARRDRRIVEQLLHWTVAAELLPAIWAMPHVGHPPQGGLRRYITGATRPCRHTGRQHVPPPHALSPVGKPPLERPNLYRGAAMCAVSRCETCPLRDLPAAAGLWEDRAGALLSGWLRDHGKQHLVNARNRVAHGDMPISKIDVAEHSKADGRELSEQFQLRLGAKPSPDDLLVAVHRALTGQAPSDPFESLDEQAAQLRSPS